MLLISPDHRDISSNKIKINNNIKENNNKKLNIFIRQNRLLKAMLNAKWVSVEWNLICLKKNLHANYKFYLK